MLISPHEETGIGLTLEHIVSFLQLWSALGSTLTAFWKRDLWEKSKRTQQSVMQAQQVRRTVELFLGSFIGVPSQCIASLRAELF